MRKYGLKIRLQEKPFQILVELLRHPGEIVTRDELREKLWPAGTFVEFDHGLNNAVNKLRAALDDTAENPRFIETLGGRGYRFVASVLPAVGHSAARAGSATAKSLLAVLPFDNLSLDPQQEYFSDGITEEMIAHLGMLSPRSLGVIARTSVMKYQNSDKTIAEIGGELGVDYVLEGSVRRAGGRVRISAQLIQVSDQTHLWARSYERELRDVFAVQTEVVMHVADSLAAELLPGQIRPLFGPDPEAHEHYLKGRYYWNKRTQPALNKGIEHFTLAIEKEPRYAQAYAGLADCYTMLAWNTMVLPAEALPRAKAAAMKALEIDPELADAHTSLAAAKMFYEWDWPGAEREFRRAIDLNPNYAVARHWYAFELAALGRHEESLLEAERASRLDPLSPAISVSCGFCLYLAGQYDRGLARAWEALEMDPNFFQAFFLLACNYERKGMSQDAVEAIEKAADLSDHNSWILGVLGNSYAVSGKKGKAREVLGELKERSRQKYVAPFNIAAVHVGLGEKDLALDWLEKAYEDHSIWLIFLNVYPVFDSLRPDPRFQQLVRRIALPPRGL